MYAYVFTGRPKSPGRLATVKFTDQSQRFVHRFRMFSHKVLPVPLKHSMQLHLQVLSLPLRKKYKNLF